MQMREKVGKSRNTVFFQWFGAPEGRKVGSLKRRVRSQLARWEMKNCTPLRREAHFEPLLGVEMSKKCTPLWREAHFEVNMYKTLHVRATFGGSDVEKVHAVVARSTFRSENVQNTRGSDHFWRFRCRFAASLHYTTLRYITPHSTILHYITLHYTPQHYNYNYTTRLHSTTLHYIKFHYTTLHSTTLHYTTLPSTTLHYITLHQTPLHYNYNYDYTTTLHYTKLHYTTLHYTTLHSTTLHYTTLHYTTLQCTEWHCTTDRQVDR